jgi:hypothetical protein
MERSAYFYYNTVGRVRISGEPEPWADAREWGGSCSINRTHRLYLPDFLLLAPESFLFAKKSSYTFLSSPKFEAFIPHPACGLDQKAQKPAFNFGSAKIRSIHPSSGLRLGPRDECV